MNDNLWYPYTQMKTMQSPLEIIKAEGVYLHTKDKKLIDSISSWWSNIYGYNNKELNNALKNQIDTFSHIMLGGLTHKPAKDFAKALVEMLDNGLEHCFFSDSGSVAVEVALKMAVQYHFNKYGLKKDKFVSLYNSYHGDTFKTMEIGDDEDYHLAFPDKNSVYHINPKIEELQKVLNENKDIAGVIFEPLMQGGGGFKLYDIEFLEDAKKLCNEKDVILIFDEVATGFGKLGVDFVSQLVEPDIIVLGKALTAGYLGHSVTIANDKVYNAFYSDDSEKAFMHGPTFMANPLACAVGLKALEIYKRDNYLDKVKKIEKISLEFFKNFKSTKVKDIRIKGVITCFELFNAEDIEGFSKFAYDKGVFNRPFLNFIYSHVPYIIEEDELITVLNCFKDWLKD